MALRSLQGERHNNYKASPCQQGKRHPFDRTGGQVNFYIDIKITSFSNDVPTRCFKFGLADFFEEGSAPNTYRGSDRFYLCYQRMRPVKGLVPETYRYPYAGPINLGSSSFQYRKDVSVSAWARGWGRPHHQIGKQSSLYWTGTGQTSNQLKRTQDIAPKEPGAFKDANKNRLRDTG